MRELKRSFPNDLDYAIVYDTTPFITESIHEVRTTLLDAVLLVALVVLLFLQNWRSAVIPLVAVPVAIIGTFAVMAAMGFSLNNLTLFGLVLAIGIVVDDAIVVVEAVEYHVEHGLSPHEATIKAMSQVSGPVIAVGLVLSAVFLPCAFISGITGQFFRQFALTIATSTLISAFNSLTLSPALAAVLLRPRGEKRGQSPFAGTALRVLCTNGDCPLFSPGPGATKCCRGPSTPSWAAGRATPGSFRWLSPWPEQLLQRFAPGLGANHRRTPPGGWPPSWPLSPARRSIVLAGRAAERGRRPRLPPVQRRLRPRHQRLHPHRRHDAPRQRALCWSSTPGCSG